MNEGDIARLIKDTIRQELAQTLMASVTSSDTLSGSIDALRFSTDSELQNLQLIRPYGFASRPPAGTQTVLHPINGDPSNIIAIGEADQTRPSLGPGEAALYGSSGQLVYSDGTNLFMGDYVPVTGQIVSLYRARFGNDNSFEVGKLKTISADVTGKLYLGRVNATSPVVLGDALQIYLTALTAQLGPALDALTIGPITAPNALVIANATTAIKGLSTAGLVSSLVFVAKI